VLFSNNFCFVMSSYLSFVDIKIDTAFPHIVISFARAFVPKVQVASRALSSRGGFYRPTAILSKWSSTQFY